MANSTKIFTILFAIFVSLHEIGGKEIRPHAHGHHHQQTARSQAPLNLGDPCTSSSECGPKNSQCADSDFVGDKKRCTCEMEFGPWPRAVGPGAVCLPKVRDPDVGCISDEQCVSQFIDSRSKCNGKCVCTNGSRMEKGDGEGMTCVQPVALGERCLLTVDCMFENKDSTCERSSSGSDVERQYGVCKVVADIQPRSSSSSGRINTRTRANPVLNELGYAVLGVYWAWTIGLDVGLFLP